MQYAVTQVECGWDCDDDSGKTIGDWTVIAPIVMY